MIASTSSRAAYDAGNVVLVDFVPKCFMTKDTSSVDLPHCALQRIMSGIIGRYHSLCTASA